MNNVHLNLKIVHLMVQHVLVYKIVLNIQI